MSDIPDRFCGFLAGQLVLGGGRALSPISLPGQALAAPSVVIAGEPASVFRI